MKYVDIAGMKASAVALGCMRMEALDKKGVNAVLSGAMRSGINFFDHADIYGRGSSEEKFGGFLKENPSVRKDIFIQTKCGIANGGYDFSKNHVLEAVNGSLKRLNTDYVDFLLLHRPDTLMEPDEVAAAFDELERAGKVRNFGVSNFNPWQIKLLKTCVKQPIVANQLQLSVTEAGMITSGFNVNMKNDASAVRDGGVLEYCRIEGITIQAWSPLQYGFFGGTYVGNREKFPALNAKFDELSVKYGVSPSAIAFAWLLRHPAKIQVVAGSMNPVHIAEAAAGADVTLTRSEWYGIYFAAGHTLP